ncbi:MAG: 3-hydroxybutyryl-CoA dehydrogenase [Firmicutes bacterium HGW-Firmicutes-12]|jgi:3-hydroxybutyryl-CoA dehydrogenase|nr:MAG: 3-hydroxybutyryl-CoA dehydrogenase [Firmicutes bacterium HGW-Firmicutes-12]
MKVMVYGTGTMGAGIAQVVAEAGMDVLIMGRSEESIQKGIGKIDKILSSRVSKGKMPQEEKDKIMARISWTTTIEDAAGVDYVIESVAERMEIKKELFKKLDSVCAPGTILATNTSALSISEIASVTARPDKVIGMHFSNPAPAMKWIEIIKGFATSDETFDFTKKLAEDFGKSPVKVEESPGFVLNRILIPMINEAIFLLAEGVASAEDIDITMKLGANHPIGPLALADLIGLDVVLFIMDTYNQEFADSKYRACPLLRKMVRAGYMGRKSGRGFYTY